MKRIVLLTVALAATTLGIAGQASAHTDDQDKQYLCHASGQEGTLKFETLHIPASAIYGHGSAGHLNEDGTPKAGHEHDYLGKCEEEEVPDTTLPMGPEDTLAPIPTTTPTTTAAPTTTTTQPLVINGPADPFTGEPDPDVCLHLGSGAWQMSRSFEDCSPPEDVPTGAPTAPATSTVSLPVTGARSVVGSLLIASGSVLIGFVLIMWALPGRFKKR